MNGQPMPPESEALQGGRGDGPYLTPVQQNHIFRMVLSKRRRFKITKAIREEMIEASRKNMKNQNGRVSNGAVANLIKMEAMNQRDEHVMLPHINVNIPFDPDARRSRIAALAERLGVDGVLEPPITGPTEVDPAANGHKANGTKGSA